MELILFLKIFDEHQKSDKFYTFVATNKQVFALIILLYSAILIGIQALKSQLQNKK